MRFLVLCLLIYVAYRMLKAWLYRDRPSVNSDEGGELARIDDVMVKDPYCEVYFARRNGIKEVINGETHYFCSISCRDKYLERIKNVSG